jgi:hypothetical protein
MTVIKRKTTDSNADLIAAIEVLLPLLQGQGEHDAIASLKEALDGLREHKVGTPKHKAAIDQILDAFEGEHELKAYTFQRDSSGSQWTEVEQLSHASARVLSLVRRMS